MTDLAGRTALITGGASGIGRLLALELTRRGARTVLWDLDEAALADADREVRQRAGASAPGYVCDVTDRRAVARVAAQVDDEIGAVDVLVNNAGVVSGKPLLELTDEAIERTFAVNVLSLYWTTRAFLPGMIERGHGHVVTVASAAGLLGVARQTDYSASKHAAVGFDEALRVELKQTAPGIRTTVVCPYYIDTGMFTGVRTRFPLLLPILEPKDVAHRMADAIVRDRPRLVMPPLIGLLPAMRLLPVRAFDAVMNVLGVNATMQHFTGRADTATDGAAEQATQRVPAQASRGA